MVALRRCKRAPVLVIINAMVLGVMAVFVINKHASNVEFSPTGLQRELREAGEYYTIATVIVMSWA